MATNPAGTNYELDDKDQDAQDTIEFENLKDIINNMIRLL
jgi:hypothetical protein